MSTPFIRQDIDLLGRHFDLDVFMGAGPGAVLEVLRRARGADVSFSWFLSVYTAFMVLGARLGGGKSIVMLGGVDTARDETLGYGVWRTPWKRYLLRYALRNADKVYAVDMSLRESLEHASGIRFDGIEPLPTGYDPEYWSPAGGKEAVVLCVAGAASEQRLLVKGLDLFAEAARRMPGVRFVVAGIDPSLHRHPLLAGAPNLEILPAQSRDQLRELYRRARVYCQPSRHEGLPNALCEGMLCGCIPVGARVGGVPDAIGDTGLLFEREDVAELCDALRRALAMPEGSGARGRERIASRYPAGVREQHLVEVIRRLADA